MENIEARREEERKKERKRLRERKKERYSSMVECLLMVRQVIGSIPHGDLF